MLWVLMACGARQPGPPMVEVGSTAGPSAEARAWALRAYRAELLGDDVEVDRSWQWARRADDDAAVFHGESLARRGRSFEAMEAFRDGLLGGAGDRARLGLTVLGVGESSWLPELRNSHPCRLWWSSPRPMGASSCRER